MFKIRRLHDTFFRHSRHTFIYSNINVLKKLAILPSDIYFTRGNVILIEYRLPIYIHSYLHSRNHNNRPTLLFGTPDDIYTYAIKLPFFRRRERLG